MVQSNTAMTRNNPDSNNSEFWSSVLQFLGLGSDDAALIERYASEMTENSHELAQNFYDYLMRHRETAAVFQNLSDAMLNALIYKQAEHANMILRSPLDSHRVQELMKIGKIHSQLGVEPGWVAGAYHLYWDHWDRQIRKHVANFHERDQLRAAMLKLILADIKVQLRGYYQAQTEADVQRLTLMNRLFDAIGNFLVNKSLSEMKPLDHFCDILVGKDQTFKLAAYFLANGNDLIPIYQSGVLQPIPVISRDEDDPIWQTLDRGAPVIFSSKDPNAPSWTAPFRATVSEMVFAAYPFGTSAKSAVGLVGAHDVSYISQIGTSIFGGVSTLATLMLKLQDSDLRDPLTDLPNLIYFHERLAHAETQVKSKTLFLGVAIIDIDQFKRVNDFFTFDIGDKVLREIAERLLAHIREEDTVARIGGDKFAILLPNLSSPSQGEAFAMYLLDVIRNPFMIEGVPYQITGSMGLNFFPLDDVDATTLLRHTEMATYKAKEAGNDQIQVYDSQITSQARQTTVHRNLLSEAMKEHRLRLYYQPIIDRSGVLVAAEALMRVADRDGGILSPTHFSLGLDHPRIARDLGRFALAEVLAQGVKWKQTGFNFALHVNISSIHLLDPRFLQDLDEALSAYPEFPPYSLEVEITETAPLRHMGISQKVLAECRRRGVRVGLDDFGTGNASLTYLQKLPVDTVKVDQSFVRNLMQEPKDLAIISGVATAASALGLTVVVEGVETADIFQLLSPLDVHQFQGFAIAHPMPPEDLPNWAIGFSGLETLHVGGR